MTCVQLLALAGIGLNLVGVLLLFRYGMPFRVETKGEGAFLLEGTDYDEIKLDRRYRLLGNAGLILVVLGSALQALAVTLA
jgi:hypothetical protein